MTACARGSISTRRINNFNVNPPCFEVINHLSAPNKVTMPPTKRALAEVDGNISSAPKSKRTCNSKTASKGSSVPAGNVMKESGAEKFVIGVESSIIDHGEADIPDDTADTVSISTLPKQWDQGY